VPPCFNSDEAAFGYNAYSILQTGKDEYGTLLPLRLKSFGDYKMPLYSYLSVPFIAVFGLNEFGTRALNTFISLLFPIIIFYFVRELFKNTKIALLSSFFISISLGLQIVARHAHESYISVFLITTTVYLFIKTVQSPSKKHIFLFLLVNLLSLLSYHPNRIFAVLLYGYSFFLFIKYRSRYRLLFLLSTILLLIFFSTDYIYKPTRINNLLFFNNEGFKLKVQELKDEGGSRFLYNVVTVGVKDIFYDGINYYSPQFLVSIGDHNNRFGYEGMGLMSITEYIFIFIGLFYLFRNKEKYRYLILILLLLAPLSASLSWSKNSLTRSLFLFVPTLIISAYGVYSFFTQQRKGPTWIILLMLYTGSLIYFNYFNWDFYLFHYPKRAVTIRAWQCGYKELGSYIKTNYDRFDTFYITKDVGMPYIFQLFYLAYPPKSYQKQAQLTSPDQYGFGQVEQFDKFIFHYENVSKIPKNSVLIGSPDDFKNDPQYKDQQIGTKKIIKGTEEMFWIYERK
jgi:4-amino-4-deoxy-L-arabinose transferase-like glycosyltransferase